MEAILSTTSEIMFFALSSNYLGLASCSLHQSLKVLKEAFEVLEILHDFLFGDCLFWTWLCDIIFARSFLCYFCLPFQIPWGARFGIALILELTIN